MASFRAKMHDAIVFNNVARISHVILKCKALFQGTSIPTTVAESTTDMHSFKVNTHKNRSLSMNKQEDWEFHQTAALDSRELIRNCCGNTPPFVDSVHQ
jgi:hypothetical protein